MLRSRMLEYAVEVTTIGKVHAAVQFINTLEEENLIVMFDQILPEEEINLNGVWTEPTIEKQKEPLQRIMTSAFDPTMPLAE